MSPGLERQLSNWLRALAAFAETLQLAPSTQMAAHNVQLLQLRGIWCPLDLH